jgi:hypothetical protein
VCCMCERVAAGLGDYGSETDDEDESGGGAASDQDGNDSSDADDASDEDADELVERARQKRRSFTKKMEAQEGEHTVVAISWK